MNDSENLNILYHEFLVGGLKLILVKSHRFGVYTKTKKEVPYSIEDTAFDVDDWVSRQFWPEHNLIRKYGIFK
ncbi:MAG: hypothetical protein WC523_04790 [Patescibacteria group bacterium]